MVCTFAYMEIIPKLNYVMMVLKIVLLVQSLQFILGSVSLQHVCTLCNLALQNKLIQLAQLGSCLLLLFIRPVALPSSSINLLYFN